MNNWQNKGGIIKLLLALLIIGLIFALGKIDNKKQSQIREFKSIVDKSKEDFYKYAFDKDEERYEKLVNECDKLIDDKKTDKYEEYEKKLEQLQVSIKEESLKKITQLLQEIKSEDLSGIEDTSVINKKINQTQELISKEYYRVAYREIDNIKEMIKEKLKKAEKMEEQKKLDKEKDEDDGEYNNTK